MNVNANKIPSYHLPNPFQVSSLEPLELRVVERESETKPKLRLAELKTEN